MPKSAQATSFVGEKKLLGREENRFFFYKPISISLMETKTPFSLIHLGWIFSSDCNDRSQTAAHTLGDQVKRNICLAIHIHCIFTTVKHTAEVKAAGGIFKNRPPQRECTAFAAPEQTR